VLILAKYVCVTTLVRVRRSWQCKANVLLTELIKDFIAFALSLHAYGSLHVQQYLSAINLDHTVMLKEYGAKDLQLHASFEK